MLEAGELDTELSKIINENTKVAKEKNDIKMAEKRRKKEQKEEDSKLLKEYYNKQKGGDRKFNYHGHQKKFFRTCETMPEYMLKKLSYLPCNKGHVWKGIHCYGDRENDGSGKLTMSERTYEGEYLTHVWTSDMYMLYKQNDKRKDILVEQRPRYKPKK